jgi:SAM-dependent methyltransferase
MPADDRDTMPSATAANLDPATVAGFGREWSRFDQTSVPSGELQRTFDAYFAVFPWQDLPAGAEGFDLGCGSGRWARLVAPRVGVLHCIDASAEALEVARAALREEPNCRLHHASVDALPLADGSMDFGYALGVLHHVPDTAAAVASAARALKPGAPLLLYLYYALEDRPAAYRALWRVSDRVRRRIVDLPERARVAATTAIAAGVYWPLARAARALERRGREVEQLPLSFYRERSFQTMRTDAYDRFCTPLERRFDAGEIRAMMSAAGLRDVVFSPDPPFWCAVGRRSGPR